jgi:hypothetical protein
VTLSAGRIPGTGITRVSGGCHRSVDRKMGNTRNTGAVHGAGAGVFLEPGPTRATATMPVCSRGGATPPALLQSMLSRLTGRFERGDLFSRPDTPDGALRWQ